MILFASRARARARVYMEYRRCGQNRAEKNGCRTGRKSFSARVRRSHARVALLKEAWTEPGGVLAVCSLQRDVTTSSCVTLTIWRWCQRARPRITWPKNIDPVSPYAWPVRRAAGCTLPRGCVHFVAIDRTWTMRKWKREGETSPGFVDAASDFYEPRSRLNFPIFVSSLAAEMTARDGGGGERDKKKRKTSGERINIPKHLS